jgi:F-type H+-transporting ATPase subunit epsilon
MAGGVFRAVVVTPESRLLDVAARAVVIRSSDGFLTVLDGHTPLVTDIVSGGVRVDPEEGASLHIAVHGGYLQVETGQGLAVDGDGDGDGEGGAAAAGDERSTRATLLAGVAELADQIDVPRAEAAKEAAQARLEELRALTGRTTAGGPSGEGEGAEAPGTPEEREMAEVEAALARAELRLAVAAGT